MKLTTLLLIVLRVMLFGIIVGLGLGKISAWTTHQYRRHFFKAKMLQRIEPLSDQPSDQPDSNSTPNNVRR